MKLISKTNLAKNNYFIGLIVLLGAVGSKSVIQEFNEKCNRYFDWFLPKVMALFALIFINTKDLEISMILSISGYLFIQYVIPDDPKKSDKPSCK